MKNYIILLCILSLIFLCTANREQSKYLLYLTEHHDLINIKYNDTIKHIYCYLSRFRTVLVVQHRIIQARVRLINFI